MKKLLNRAMSLLARRDHSEYELRRKLAAQSAFGISNSCSKKYGNNSVLNASDVSAKALTREELNGQIERVIQYCYEHHWLDDEKFASNFIRSRCLKGYGPQRIKLELKQKGINNEVISLVFANCDIDWAELAQELFDRNLKRQPENNWKIKAKVYNQLANKGFYPDDISKALKKSTF